MDHDHDHETPTGFIKVDNQIIFTQKFAKIPTQIYESMVNVLKQLEDTKRVNEVLKNEFHEREDHDKKRTSDQAPFIFLTASFHQRTFKFPDPEKYGKAREKFESFKNIFRVKFRANYDWYPTKNMKLDYVFFCLKKIARTQILFKMSESNVLKFHSVEKLLRC